MIAQGENSYTKSKGFGIISKSKGPHIRSFKFLGKRSAITYRWNEDYIPNFKDKWQINVHPNAKNKLSNYWSYVVDDNFILEGKKQKLRAILHRGKVTNESKVDFGSWIDLKNADWANGKIKFNILLYDIKPMAVLFRYTDKDNYYSVEFSANSIENVKFMKNIEGSQKIISSKTVKMLLGKWYRVVIILDYENIKIQMQSHDIRQHKTLFKKKIVGGLSRGSLGFASRGNTKFYLNGISIDEHKPDRKEKFKNNRRSWNTLLKFLKFKQRKNYCQNLFNQLKEEVPRCIEIHNYCRIRCDKLIPTVETILNFSCQRDCVRTANILESKKDELGRLGKRGTWIPKKNEKCDYLPKGETTYRMGFVKSVDRKGKKLIVKVEYLVAGTSTAKAEVNFPSKDLKRCGEALTARMDCLLK